MTALYGVVIALAVVTVLMGIIVVGLLRSHAEILKRLDSLGAGLGNGHEHESQISLTPPSEARLSLPDITGVNPDGEPVVASPNLGSDPTLLAFLSTSCSSCSPFWDKLDASSRYFHDYRHRVLIVTRGSEEESPTRAQSLRRGQADVIMSSQAWDDYEVPGAPYFVLIGPGNGGIAGEGSAATFDSLEQFLADSVNDSRWDRDRVNKQRTDSLGEKRVDEDLKRAGLGPDDPRLYSSGNEISDEDEE